MACSSRIALARLASPRRWYPCLLAVLAAGLAPSAAEAHGPPPSALSVVRWQEGKPELVRLNVGMAKLRGEGHFEYLCPARWNEIAGSPVLALPDGNAVVTSPGGLFVVDAEGHIRPHPEAGSLSGAVALSKVQGQVMALVAVRGGSELWRLDAASAEQVWTSESRFQTLTAQNDQLILGRVWEGELTLLTLSPDGNEVATTTLAAPPEATHLQLRPYADSLAIVLVVPGGLRLAQLEDGALEVRGEAQNRIAGPAGRAPSLVALDGRLHALDAGQLLPADASPYVGCLVERAPGESYACTDQGIRLVAGPDLSDDIFRLSSLSAPDYEAIASEPMRSECRIQWEDLRFDLLAIGIEVQPDEPAAQAPVEAADLPDAAVGDAEPADAGLASDAPAADPHVQPPAETDDGTTPDSGKANPASGDDEPPSPKDAPAHEQGGGGCQLGAGHTGSPAGLVLLALLRLRRRKSRADMTA